MVDSGCSEILLPGTELKGCTRYFFCLGIFNSIRQSIQMQYYALVMLYADKYCLWADYVIFCSYSWQLSRCCDLVIQQPFLSVLIWSQLKAYWNLRDSIWTKGDTPTKPACFCQHRYQGDECRRLKSGRHTHSLWGHSGRWTMDVFGVCQLLSRLLYDRNNQ